MAHVPFRRRPEAVAYVRLVATGGVKPNWPEIRRRGNDAPAESSAFYISAVGRTGDRFYASATFERFKPAGGEFGKFAPRLQMTSSLNDAMPYRDRGDAEVDLAAYRSAPPGLSDWTLAPGKAPTGWNPLLGQHGKQQEPAGDLFPAG
jgi:hypothetical protein